MPRGTARWDESVGVLTAEVPMPEVLVTEVLMVMS